ncbi:MAG: hypothetical protein V4550_18110 [Gemmatimonadota bacterium]
MSRRALALVLLLPALAEAQTVSVGVGAERRSAAFITEANSQPHVVIAGEGRVEFPRDSTITSTLIVIGRPTYLSSKVEGNVVVIGADLFLRPGSAIRGHAVAIGGTVAVTTLGTVGGRVESYRDDQYEVRQVAGGYLFDYRAPLVVASSVPLVQPAGLMGLLLPSYDRVNGLSLPVGALFALSEGKLEATPTVTYRSRLGALDPGVRLRINPDGKLRLDGTAGYDTRTNEGWNYGDLVNSATTFFAGSDTRNYFRAKGGVARVIGRLESVGRTIEPFAGGRFERLSAISAGCNVFTVTGRKSVEKACRPNPAVDAGDIGSLLAGAQLWDTSGVVVSRVRAELERSVTSVIGASNFTQLTFDGRIGFPTFGTQSLHVRGHAVATMGDKVPLARYAYLGGSGTLPVTELLEFGGTQLLFVESRYLIPVPAVQLPFVGSPILTLRHILGGAGVGSLPKLEQEVGIGLGLSALRIDLTVDASRHRDSRLLGKLGFGISLTN